LRSWRQRSSGRQSSINQVFYYNFLPGWFFLKLILIPFTFIIVIIIILDDLRGLRVGHEMDLEEGQETILTLKDSTILENEDEGDELESIHMVAKNKLKENLELKKKKTIYSGVDDEEFGSDGCNDPFLSFSLLIRSPYSSPFTLLFYL